MESKMKRAFFSWVTENPLRVVLVGVSMILFFAYGLTGIVKDTSADAFIPKEHPALVNKEKLSQLFGLEDPIVMVIENREGVFNVQTLELVYGLSETIQEFSEVRNDGVTSLSTQKNIYGIANGMEVEPFIEDAVVDATEAKRVEAFIDAFPLMQGTLVSRDRKATLIIVDLKDSTDSESLYFKLQELSDNTHSEGISLYVAGEGAVSGYMGSYIDRDAMRLNPVAAIVIMIVLYIAFRRLGAVLLPNLVIAGAAVTALGAMGFSGVSFFVITNALPVVLIGISVADSIHILSTYYERRRDLIDETHKEAVIETMLEMWRPVGLTTLTTMAGFLGLSLSSTMPPMIYFGIFAMFGVAMAWLFSITVLPAMIALLRLKPSPRFRKRESDDASSLSHIGKIVSQHPKKVLLIASSIAIIGLIGLIGLSKLVVNEDRIATFHQDEPIVQADKIINSRFDGSHYLDILVDSFEEEGLFEPSVMQKVEEFQSYVETLAHVNGSVAYTDYLKQMNRALFEADEKMYRLPASADASAQYFLLYSARAAADDLEHIIDYDYQKANIRIYMDSGEYIHEKLVIDQIAKYLLQDFNTDALKGEISGRVNVEYHWVLPIEKSHFQGIAIALGLVLLMALISFRSLYLAVLVTLPVVLSILMIYAIMGYSGIWLGVGTSMFASIAIGLGVDFAVHTAERMQSLRSVTTDMRERTVLLYSSTGRALLFNALALAFGFGVLVTSKVVPLVKFGSLVAVAIGSSFMFSLLIIPAVMIVMNKDR